MKKGKKMPSIEIDGHSEEKFELRDGKIVRVVHRPEFPSNSFEPRMRD